MFDLIENLRETYGTGQLVTIGALIVGLAFGVVAEVSRYCLRAAIVEHAEASSGQADYSKTLQFLMAILVALVGTQLFYYSGLLDLPASIHWAVTLKPIALVVGGLMFGAGMILAGGCVSRLLILAASGNVRSVITLIVTGLAGYATLRGLLSYPRIWLETAWETGTSSESLLASGNVLLVMVAIIGTTATIALLHTLRKHRSGASSQSLLAGGLVGALIVAAWFVTGVVGADEFEPTPLTALSFVAPVGETIQYFMIFTGDTIRFSIALVLGVLIGAGASALLAGRSSFRGFQDEPSVLRYLAGGALMGFGGVTALGCSVGQGLSGISTASPASIIAIFAIVSGAFATSKLQAALKGKRQTKNDHSGVSAMASS